MEHDVVVVGAGPAGLAAALGAARRGREVTVLDAADRIGGMAASHVVAGQRVDLGSHRLHVAAPPRVATLLESLLGADLQARTRNGRLRVAERWIDFPFPTSQLLAALGPVRGARMAAELATAPLRTPRADTYAEEIRVGLGPTALDAFHGPMAHKLWGLPPERLAGELARRRVSVRSPAAALARVVSTSRPSGRRFRYPRRGYGQIVERLADAAADAGATIRTGAAVTAVQPSKGDVGLTVDGAAWHARQVLWTAPVQVLAEVAGGPDAHMASHRAMVLVYAVVDRPRWRDVDAHYVPGPEVPASRISEPKQYRDNPDDPRDRSVVCIEVPCTAGDALWETTATGWQDRLDDDLSRLGLPTTGTDHVEVVRLPRVYPVIRPEDVVPRAGLLTWARRLPGVAVFGRQGLHVGDNIHHVLDMGLAAADCCTPDGGWDQAGWDRAQDRFDTFVVED